MKQLEDLFSEKVLAYLADTFDQQVTRKQLVFNQTKPEFEGDLTLVCFPLGPVTKQSPETTARQIGEYLEAKSDLIEKFNVIKGFLNLTITDSYWVAFVEEALKDESCWRSEAMDRTVLIESSSPNTNKPQHLGHIRNNLLGESVARILSACGSKVIRANLFNDRGVQIFQSLLAWRKWGNEHTPASSGQKGDHFVGQFYVRYTKEVKRQEAQLIKKGCSKEEARQKAPLRQEVRQLLKNWEAGDPEVVGQWKQLNDWVYEGFDYTYKKLGVAFDELNYESETYKLGKKLIEQGLKKEVFYKKPDGSVWANLTDQGLDEKLLLRADGTSVYITQDLGTARQRYEKHKMDTSVYVVGNEQEYHFKVLRALLQKLEEPYADGIFHLSYGMIDLPSGKMKSREGTVVDADDLIQQMTDTARNYTSEAGKAKLNSAEEEARLYEMIGLGALKFHLLKVEPKKNMLFNPEESIDFQGHTGPFIQYTYARIRSLLRKWEKHKAGEMEPESNYRSLLTSEKVILRQIAHYPHVLEEAARQYAPSALAQFAYELAKSYNHLYANTPILNADEVEETVFRIQLSKLTAEALKQAAYLLGMEVPKRM